MPATTTGTPRTPTRPNRSPAPTTTTDSAAAAAVHVADFRVMASPARVVVVVPSGDDAAGESLLAAARARLDQLEARWSRFRPASEVNRLHERAGRPVVVSRDTYALVERSVDAWRHTRGRFDPTVRDALEAAGYDRTFTDVPADGPPRAPARRAPGCGGIVLDPVVEAVTLPRGVRLDPGAIGKGLAADLVTAELRAAGALGALVDVGGDIHAAGVPPTSDGWVVAVEDPWDASVEVARFTVDGGGVATSSTVRRRWRAGGVTMHHVIDPVTGEPATTDLATATVVAADAWWAEALATAALVGGRDAAVRLLREADVDAVLVTAEREIVAV